MCATSGALTAQWLNHPTPGIPRLPNGKPDLDAPAPKTLRAVYYETRSPYRHFQGDRTVRDALVADSYRWLNRTNLAEFLEARVADRAPSVVVFATDCLPLGIADPGTGEEALVNRYLKAGGKVVWVGGPPLLYRYDPKTLEFAKLEMADLKRRDELLGLPLTENELEGLAKVQATPLGRAWGLPDGWWIEEAELATARPGVEVLASDVHGHPAVWVKTYGGPPGTGFVRYWGRDRELPDVAVVEALAEHGMP
jgi:hypothetical protein